MQPIKLAMPWISGGRISVPIEPGDARPYLTGREFWVDYGSTDLSSLDSARALLPALGTLIPIAIAAGLGVQVPVLDRTFAGQAEQIAATMRKMYPHFAQNGYSLLGPLEDECEIASPKDSQAALLYSGGIDSVASLIRHRDAVDCIISVWGADVELEDVELWRRLQNVINAAPTRRSTRRIVARSNLRQILDNLRLNRHFDSGFPGTNWWGGAHHGLGLVALAAPLTVALGLSRVIVASSHSSDFNVPWGSNPELDNQIQWRGAAAHHDGFELDRQDKIQKVVGPWINRGTNLSLAVCYQVNRGGRNVNCGRCEKCMRTVSGFLAAGVDPARAGIPVSEETLAGWRGQLEARGIRFGLNEMFMWRAIQRGIDAGRLTQDFYGSSDYLQWLKRFDLTQLADETNTRVDGVGNMPVWRYHAERMGHRIPYRFRRWLRSDWLK